MERKTRWNKVRKMEKRKEKKRKGIENRKR